MIEPAIKGWRRRTIGSISARLNGGFQRRALDGSHEACIADATRRSRDPGWPLPGSMAQATAAHSNALAVACRTARTPSDQTV
ncbi:hypothetical protein [Paraburkholderia piptadeniae]|uniref:hypothetical protein n=1 Tax=Paraburkholderia piptadeniae TaxID=1701573 RepID=UPI000B4027D7|nr:hypothetical protein [Paraburkholderia piptadeniae]